MSVTDIQQARSRLARWEKEVAADDFGEWYTIGQQAADIRTALDALDASEKKLALAIAMYPPLEPQVTLSTSGNINAATPQGPTPTFTQEDAEKMRDMGTAIRQFAGVSANDLEQDEFSALWLMGPRLDIWADRIERSIAP